MEMAIQAGDQVLVNVAPFVGSVRRSKDSIPCRVVAVDESHVQVETDYPYRTVSLWILSDWIEGKLEQQAVAAPNFCGERSKQRRRMATG
jgi:hypothetical protein